MLTCGGCGAENPDRAKFCLECGSPLAAPTPAAEVRKTVTVLFCDVTGSTALGERLDAEAMRAVMSRYFATVSRVIESHGGTVEKFIGDAVMAVFGVPVLHEDDALRATRAAAGIRDALRELNDALDRDHGVRLEVRVGVNTGEVVVGTDAGKGTVATGDAVNTAARLQSAADPGEILLGEETWALVRNGAHAEPLAPLTVKGKSEAIPCWRLVDVSPETTAVDRDGERQSPLVGRDREVVLLTQTFERCAADRRSQLVTMLGAAGVGKTRLMGEVLARLPGEPVVLHGRCLSYGEDIVFWPLQQMLRELVGLGDGETAARERLRALLGEDPDAAAVLERLAPLAGLGGNPGDAEDTHWALRRLVEALGRNRPVVVVLDDVHWAEPAMLDVVEHLADWTRETALLLVCLARPEFLDDRPHWGGGKLNATTVLLEPLGADAAEELMDNLLTGASLDGAVRQQILAAAGGTPLFVEQMLAMLVDEGLLHRDEDGRHTGDVGRLEVPATISALLAARLDRLPATERTVLETASVMGLTFYRDAVAELCEVDTGPALLALTRKELVRPDRSDLPGRDAFRFLHVLVRDEAYAAMPKARRADAHERFAGWLEKGRDDSGGDADEFIAHHLEQAVRLRTELGPADAATRQLAARAAARFTAAARRLVLADPESSGSLSERAAALLDPRDPARLDRLRDVAAAREELGDFAVARALYERVRDEARGLGDERRATLCELDLVTLASQVEVTGLETDKLEAVTRLLEQFRRDGDDEGMLRAGLARLAVLNALALWGPMAELAQELIGPCDRIDDPRARGSLQMTLGASLFFGPAPIEQALAETESEQPEAPRSVAIGRAFARAAVLAYCDRVQEAWDALAAAEALLAESTNPIAAGFAAFGGGSAYRNLGDLTGAERRYREGLEALRAVGETGWRSSIAPLLGQVRLDNGDVVEARALAEEGRATSQPSDRLSQAEWRGLLACLEAREGNDADALPLADRAVAELEPTDDINSQADMLVIRAEVHALAGRAEEAAADLHAALDRYERKGNRPAARRTRERLAVLSSPG